MCRRASYCAGVDKQVPARIRAIMKGFKFYIILRSKAVLLYVGSSYTSHRVVHGRIIQIHEISPLPGRPRAFILYLGIGVAEDSWYL